MNRVKERIVNADKNTFCLKKHIFSQIFTAIRRALSSESRGSRLGKGRTEKRKKLSRGEISLRMRRGIVEAGVKHKSGYVVAFAKNEGGQHTPMLPASYFLLYLFTPSPIGEIDCP